MASTTALFTGLSGLAVNARRLDVIGNNIANVNTVAFKSNRMVLAPAFSRNFSLGSAPSAQTGGTNPGQIGLGAVITGTQRNFNDGSISATGVATDVAIEGDGFFIVDFSGEQRYTRAGDFQLNSANDLVTIAGAKVQGYGVDAQFNVVTGTLVDVNIPLGTLTLAEATRNVDFNGNLNASGFVTTSGSLHESRALIVDDDGDPTTDPVLPGTAATTATDLTDGVSHLFIDDGAGGQFLAIESGVDAIVTLSGIEKGGKDMGTATFAFTTDAGIAATVDDSGTTLGDFLDFLDEYLGLDRPVPPPVDDALWLGAATDINASGQLAITGNEGTVQDLDIETADIVVTYPGATVGTPISQPFVMAKTGVSNGESVRTSFVVFDSLGTPLTVDLTFVLQATNPSQGSTWLWAAESSDNDSLDRFLGKGQVDFDANGRFVSATNQSFSIARTNGSVDPLTINMNFDNGTDAISGLTDTASQLAAVFQDGSPIGTLSQFSIGDDGIIAGSFTNGLTRTIGQVALAKFANNAGLVDAGNNLFRTGPNSGTALVTTPLQFGTGRLVGGALELSNVDLSQEFINMILTSTGYTASSRVITVTDQLIDQLLQLVR
jgi:flagellar hook protein FlgE